MIGRNVVLVLKLDLKMCAIFSHLKHHDHTLRQAKKGLWEQQMQIMLDKKNKNNSESKRLVE